MTRAIPGWVMNPTPFLKCVSRNVQTYDNKHHPYLLLLVCTLTQRNTTCMSSILRMSICV